jgi:hypothetical protein
MSKPKKRDLTLVVYVIHFEPPLVTARHYVGITTADRLYKRFAEHACGRGSRLTAVAAAEGCTFHLAQRIEAQHPFDETRWQEHYAKGHKCPICSGSPPLKTIRPKDNASMDRWREHQLELREMTVLNARDRP